MMFGKGLVTNTMTTKKPGLPWLALHLNVIQGKFQSSGQSLSNPFSAVAHGMFQFCGRVINAAAKASDPVMTSTVMCCEVKNAVKFPGSPLFYDLTHGDQFVTLDAPFVLNMGEDPLTKRDSEGGVAVIFCWRYHLGGENGVVLENAGLAFLQHLSYNRHLCNLLTLAKLLEPQMNKFSTKIANMQADLASNSSAWPAIEPVQGSVQAGSEGHVAGSN